MSAPRPDIDGIFLPDKAVCELCGEPMPKGEEMFKFHGYSGPCPKPPLRAPRPEGMSETPVDERLEQAEVERRASLPMLTNSSLYGWDATAILYAREIVRLRADKATLKVRADEALAAHAASFGALQTLSAALFDGEVDDYAALAEKVIARVRQLEADGATLREELVSGRAQWQQERDEYRQIVESSETALATLRERVRHAECVVRAAKRVIASVNLKTVNEQRLVELQGAVTGWNIAVEDASAPKEPTPHVHTTMGASGPCTICGVPVRCSNLKDGQVTCDEPNVYCAHPKCLQPKEPTPHAVRETGWLIEHSQEGLLKYWSPSSTEHRTWVIDPWQAVRFSRREDAERVKVALNYAFSAVIEHAFMPKEPTPHGKA